MEEDISINPVPNFESSINFKENKGTPLRPFLKHHNSMIQRKPYARFSTYREKNNTFPLKEEIKNYQTKNMSKKFQKTRTLTTKPAFRFSDANSRHQVDNIVEIDYL